MARRKQRYPSDNSNDQWELIEPLLPEVSTAGRPEKRGQLRRWAVEPTFAWITTHRRLARDCERHPTHSEAMVRWAAISTIARRIAQGGPATRQQERT